MSLKDRARAITAKNAFTFNWD